MNEQLIEPYQVFIYLGFKERDSGIIHTLDECEAICQEYCDKLGLCVTVTPTRFIYTNGNEPGCFIGLINYPRFPSTSKDIFAKATQLGKILMDRFNQYRVTIQSTNNVLMLNNINLENE